MQLIDKWEARKTSLKQCEKLLVLDLISDTYNTLWCCYMKFEIQNCFFNICKFVVNMYWKWNWLKVWHVFVSCQNWQTVAMSDCEWPCTATGVTPLSDLVLSLTVSLSLWCLWSVTQFQCCRDVLWWCQAWDWWLRPCSDHSGASGASARGGAGASHAEMGLTLSHN